MKLVLYGSRYYKEENIYTILEIAVSTNWVALWDKLPNTRSVYAKSLEDIYQKFSQELIKVNDWVR